MVPLISLNLASFVLTWTLLNLIQWSTKVFPQEHSISPKLADSTQLQCWPYRHNKRTVICSCTASWSLQGHHTNTLSSCGTHNIFLWYITSKCVLFSYEFGRLLSSELHWSKNPQVTVSSPSKEALKVVAPVSTSCCYLYMVKGVRVVGKAGKSLLPQTLNVKERYLCVWTRGTKVI